jgi:hypothetical protein
MGLGKGELYTSVFLFQRAFYHALALFDSLA